MPLRQLTATRYVTPLREGGSLPALVEADDLGLYVLKFRGAGQGIKALQAELICAGLAQVLGLPVPEVVLMQLDAELARTEPDPEIQDLIKASAGLNLALDYLPGSVTFDPLMHPPDVGLASRIVWFDAFISNVDRTPRNSNLLVWHRRLWLIDHGAALIFHHAWGDIERQAESAFTHVRDHVLLPWAGALADADAALTPLLTPERIADVLAQLPDAWLQSDPAFASAAAQRDAYQQYFEARLRSRRFVATAQEAYRAQHA